MGTTVTGVEIVMLPMEKWLLETDYLAVQDE
jgi:hypothetical protein